MNKNVIQLRNRFVNLPNAGADNHAIAMSVVSELMQFGFLLDEDAIKVLSAASREDIVRFHNETIKYLKDITGANRNYQPFWKGFPEQVMEMSECELWLHQIVHYISNGTYEPSEWVKEKPTAFEQPNYIIIKAGDEDRFLKIFTDLCSVNNSLTPDDLEVIKWFVSTEQVLRFPESIPFKENLCTLAAMGLDVPVRTVTDVLRIAVGMSGGDVSLPKVPTKLARLNRWSSYMSVNPERENFKFKKFTRAERRYLLGLLEKTGCDASEAVLKDQRWVRLGEILHPGEYSTRFPKAFVMFNSIRNEKVKSWESKLERAFKNSLEDGLEVLTERPGVFMRKLDWLVRNNTDSKLDMVLNAFESVSQRVSNKVLFEAFSHFDGREKSVTNRTIMIKGARKRTTLPDLPAIDKKVVERIQAMILTSVKSRFSTLEKLGSVFVDEELKNIPVPTNMRSLNSALRPTVRGQRIPMGNQNAKVIRAFVHWFDERGNRDLDLTCTFAGMGKVRHIGWNGDKNTKMGCYSGDIRHRQGACAEYIDIVVAEALKEGYKYAIIDVHNYNGGTLAEITDCVFGYMEREKPSENTTFKPDTLSNTVRLQSPSSSTIVAMIDLETQEYIFLDIDKDGIPVTSADFDGLMKAIKPYCEPPKVSVYDLLLMHVDARGGQLAAPEDAQVKFNYYDFSESYVETLKLMGV